MEVNIQQESNIIKHTITTKGVCSHCPASPIGSHWATGCTSSSQYLIVPLEPSVLGFLYPVSSENYASWNLSLQNVILCFSKCWPMNRSEFKLNCSRIQVSVAPSPTLTPTILHLSLRHLSRDHLGSIHMTRWASHNINTWDGTRGPQQGPPNKTATISPWALELRLPQPACSHLPETQSPAQRPR